MIVRIALKAPNGFILNKTFLGVTALVDPQTHVLQIFNRNKVVIAEYPSLAAFRGHAASSTIGVAVLRTTQHVFR